MLTCDYKVLSIDGDYAHLERQDAPENEPKLVTTIYAKEAMKK